ncbi:hypothetical protein GCM10018779_32040 [Streptomyces griseocarneus]|nr:hypothetical protein GCM10018779_32040 [Streptomyces griseocarneus]
MHRDDQLFLLGRGGAGNVHHVIRAADQGFQLTVWPDDITVSPNAHPQEYPPTLGRPKLGLWLRPSRGASQGKRLSALLPCGDPSGGRGAVSRCLACCTPTRAWRSLPQGRGSLAADLRWSGQPLIAYLSWGDRFADTRAFYARLHMHETGAGKGVSCGAFGLGHTPHVDAGSGVDVVSDRMQWR